MILALIPAHNEASRIAAVVEGARRHLPVLVVDDGSADATAAVAAGAGATVLRLDANHGKGDALKAGFRHALGDGAQAVVTLDADGQHDPAEIPGFVAAWRRDAPAVQLVVGVREFRSMPPARRLANALGKQVLRWATGREILDNQSGFRLVGRPLMEAMLASDEPGFGFEVEMIVECARREWGIAWVPIRTIYGAEKSHINPVTHLARFLALAVRIRRARGPAGATRGPDPPRSDTP